MPYPGQGKQLPASLNREGEWLYENRFFFAVNCDGAPDRSLLAPDLMLPDGRRCHGFDADKIAEKLGMTGNDLLSLNRDGQITYNVSGPFREGCPDTIFVKTAKGTVSVVLK